MSIARLTEVGVAAADAAVLATDRSGGDPDAATLRMALFEFLRAFMEAAEEHVDDAADSRELLDAYRDWLDTGAELFKSGDTALLRDYARKRGVLAAEMELEMTGAAAPVAG